jgi:hypothetical protein
VEAVQWTFDNINSESSELHHLAAFLADKKIELVINLPMHGGGARRYVINSQINSKILIFKIFPESHHS